VQLGVHAALSRRRSRVQIPSGRVAQLVERAPEKREVTGSTPVSTTIKAPETMFSFFWAITSSSALRGNHAHACVVLARCLVPTSRKNEVASQTLNNDVVFAQGLMHQPDWLDSRHDL
jgi:hypothetical protein